MESLKLTSEDHGSSGSGGRLQDKVAIVTGGGSGFGAAIAVRFAQEGAKVLIGDINLDGAEKTASICGQDNCKVLSMNAASEDDWKKAVQTCLSAWEKIDIVVNNAGVAYKNKPSLEVSEAEFEKCYTVNVKSLFWCVGAVVPVMKKQNSGGSIVNISSVGASRPRPGLVWYNASKAAVSNATKALAAEYGPDQIRINAINPLLCNTGLFETFAGVPYSEENMKKFLFNVPMGRLTDPKDVANSALFLASDESRFTTGIELPVDGGRSV